MLIRTKLDFEDNYSQIPNAWLRDEKLSLKAKGLLAQILTHSPGWAMTITSLAKANGCGKDQIRSAIKELLAAGYLHKSDERERDAQGRLGDYTYTTISPKPRKAGRVAYVGKSNVGKAYVGKPDTKNNIHIDIYKEDINNIDINNIKRGKRIEADWQPSEELYEWAQNIRPDLNIDNTIEEFRDYWQAVSGSKGVKADWAATWRNWVRRTQTRDTPKTNTQSNLELHAKLFPKPQKENHHEPRTNIRALDSR
jgi:hypothetical protein